VILSTLPMKTIGKEKKICGKFVDEVVIYKVELRPNGLGVTHFS
jgi:hypothetical protein